MSHSNTDIQVPITVLSIIIMVSSIALMFMFNDIGKESRSLEILTQCKNGEIVTINDTEIHCGIISKEINIKAAQYRAVKNCVKLIKEWEDE